MARKQLLVDLKPRQVVANSYVHLDKPIVVLGILLRDLGKTEALTKILRVVLADLRAKRPGCSPR